MKDRGRILAFLLTSPSAFHSAFDKMKLELEELTEKRVSENELRLEKASNIGRQELSMMKYSTISHILLSYASVNLPLDHDRFTMRKISELTEEDVRLAAERWLGSGTSYTSLAGGLDVNH